MTSLRVFSLLLPALLLAACGSKQSMPEDIRVVRTAAVTADEAGSGSGYSGEVRARHESVVGFRVSGRVAERLVQVGNRVSRNQPLARLDPVDAALNADAARAQLQGVRSEYAQVELDFERAKRLFERRFISQAEFDRDRVQLESSRAKLVAAESEFALASNQQGYTFLRAPQDGVVTALYVEVGEVVQAGQRALGFSADGEREVAISIPESRLEEIRQVGDLQVELWARPGRRYVGKLRELAPMTDSATRQYDARISIVDPDEAIELGMTARVHLAGQRKQQTYRLPLSALYHKGGESFVWVVSNGDSIVHARQVEVADVGQDAVVVAGGVQPGETIVTAGVHLLFDGQKVRLAAGGV
ncbi:efflux RND transporter periplasmic adaptor subunit [Steroidobacter sp.]|uniref:efflux RND transporter periplasmic adaptor subunit n=1 Tax=Steroidobacter sp. TaxID=1978227 RepID=UPI001A3C4A0C|nr:efflux RND transporter periplasmic adaptor subunit [Steroidobacter sp.]MBL8269073.1 efflux RND transporter periplasmic adaptor subunit [Steroidobacter sp.]